MGDVSIFGSVNIDLVTYVQKVPVLGETVTGGTYRSFNGGKGANQAVAAARAGAQVRLYACVGDDSFGIQYLQSLKDAGIDCRGICIKKDSHTGIAQIMVDKEGNNIIAVAPGANFSFKPEDITEHQPAEGAEQVALFQNEIPQSTTEKLIEICKQKRMTVIWNIAPAPGKQPSRTTLGTVDFLICNQVELKTITGSDSIERATEQLLDRGTKRIIVTMGADGLWLLDQKRKWHQPAFKVNPVDTVGAGDCFCGVFASGLSNGYSIELSLKRAAAAAALSTLHKGAQTSMPGVAQIDEFIAGSI